MNRDRKEMSKRRNVGGEGKNGDDEAGDRIRVQEHSAMSYAGGWDNKTRGMKI